MFDLGIALTEQEEVVLRNVQEAITGEKKTVLGILDRLDTLEYIGTVRLVRKSLYHCWGDLEGARMAISNALAHNFDH